MPHESPTPPLSEGAGGRLIPLSAPDFSGNEWKYAKECLDTGQVSAGGAFAGRFEEAMAAYAGAKHALACLNGAAALHLSLRLLGVEAGDYVILPNLASAAAAGAVAHAGAEPLLIDVDPDSWQLSLDLLEDFLSFNTVVNDEDELILKRDGRRLRAIMAVHALGNMADMEGLLFIARRYHLGVLEDASEALGSRFREKHAGAFGNLGVFSFDDGQLVATGGGAVIVTGEEALARRARRLSSLSGTSPGEHVPGEPGYDCRMANIPAAIGLAQLEQLPHFLERKKEIAAYYRQQLEGVGDIGFQRTTPGVDPNYGLFTIRTEKMRPLQQRLNAHAIESRPLWVPVNRLPMYSQCLYIRREDHSARLYDSCLSLPSSGKLADEQLEEVVKRMVEFFR